MTSLVAGGQGVTLAAMAKNQQATTLGISLPVEMAQAVFQEVRDGRFTSASEVVREALQRMLGDAASGGDTPPERAVERVPRRGRRRPE